MSSHGGMIGLVLYTLWFSKKYRLSWTGIGDSLCVVAPIGLLFGRLANFINGELWGKPTDVSWAVIFPDDPLPRHPSQLYEAGLEGVVLLAVLWILRTRCRCPRGVLTGAFFLFYAVLRIVGEVFREPDPAWAVGRFSAGQFLSLFLVVMGAAFIAWGLKTQQYERADEAR
jgi:phosphatidylglycerol:prolipoprotein diacylglycerol transferase